MILRSVTDHDLSRRRLFAKRALSIGTLRFWGHGFHFREADSLIGVGVDHGEALLSHFLCWGFLSGGGMIGAFFGLKLKFVVGEVAVLVGVLDFKESLGAGARPFGALPFARCLLCTGYKESG